MYLDLLSFEAEFMEETTAVCQSDLVEEFIDSGNW